MLWHHALALEVRIWQIYAMTCLLRGKHSQALSKVLTLGKRPTAITWQSTSGLQFSVGTYFSNVWALKVQPRTKGTPPKNSLQILGALFLTLATSPSSLPSLTESLKWASSSHGTTTGIKTRCFQFLIGLLTIETLGQVHRYEIFKQTMYVCMCVNTNIHTQIQHKQGYANSPYEKAMNVD